MIQESLHSDNGDNIELNNISNYYQMDEKEKKKVKDQLKTFRKKKMFCVCLCKQDLKEMDKKQNKQKT